jgi:hypothetical protein
LQNALSDVRPPRLLKSSLPRYSDNSPDFLSIPLFNSQTASGVTRL